MGRINDYFERKLQLKNVFYRKNGENNGHNFGTSKNLDNPFNTSEILKDADLIKNLIGHWSNKDSTIPWENWWWKFRFFVQEYEEEEKQKLFLFMSLKDEAAEQTLTFIKRGFSMERIEYEFGKLYGTSKLKTSIKEELLKRKWNKQSESFEDVCKEISEKVDLAYPLSTEEKKIAKKIKYALAAQNEMLVKVNVTDWEQFLNFAKVIDQNRKHKENIIDLKEYSPLPLLWKEPPIPSTNLNELTDHDHSKTSRVFLFKTGDVREKTENSKNLGGLSRTKGITPYSFTVTAQINNVNFIAVISSATQHSLLAKNITSKLSLSNKTYSSAAIEKINDDRAKFNIQIGDFLGEMEFKIIDSTRNDAIIGIDMLVRYDARISFNSSLLLLRKEGKDYDIKMYIIYELL
ncbi:unnamed protein product [Dimorphilus gyrociliatus]|uniref:Uncharacterized protein n=1 Tax=Dimorphilus gyrociliatus TaxID=2664684 RepID=A0A7I8V736_9ANNE|nr:unnamed protein product [Dimorphilus gyrociliatus]